MGDDVLTRYFTSESPSMSAVQAELFYECSGIRS